jgi:hypothetical protein
MLINNKNKLTAGYALKVQNRCDDEDRKRDVYEIR